jgi:hypothetical protein
MSTTRVRVRFRVTLHHSVMACRFFVLERPALHRLAANTTARYPAIRRWLVRRIDDAQVLPFVQAAPVMQQMVPVEPLALVVPQAQVSAAISLMVPAVTAAEVDHVRYLFQRAADARR